MHFCSRSRTVANGCAVANMKAASGEHRSNPQTPKVKREPFATIRENIFPIDIMDSPSSGFGFPMEKNLKKNKTHLQQIVRNSGPFHTVSSFLTMGRCTRMCQGTVSTQPSSTLPQKNLAGFIPAFGGAQKNSKFHQGWRFE